MREIDWSKAPKDATHAGYAGSNICWYKHSDGVWFFLYNDDYYSGASEWEKAIGNPGHTPLIKRIPTWSGTGLPPVGQDIEYKTSSDTWKSGQYIGQFKGKMVVGCNETCVVGLLNGDEMRPVRTPEQIAAEEREKALSAFAAQLYRDVGMDKRDAELLFNRGYRKQGEQP